MKRFKSRFSAPEEKTEVPKPSAFDLLTKLFLPSLSLVAVIVGQLQQQGSSVLWGLLAFASLSLAVGFYGPIRAGVWKRVWTRRDERTARQSFPEFRKFVRQFGEFVDTNKSDTLHNIALGELCGRDASNLQKLNIPSAELFSSFWFYFKERIERETPSLPTLNGLSQNLDI